MKEIAEGIWPTMLTPYTASGAIDEQAVEALVEWYIDQGVDGIFAVCQSSEMFFLSLEERVRLASLTVRFAHNRVPVIASGHVSDTLEEQERELQAISDTGIDALVLVSNRFADEGETSDDVWKKGFERVVSRIPETLPLGFYECPYPYKKVFSLELLQWLSDTGRVGFLKDTCCDLEMIERRARTFSGTSLKLYNANSATLLQSLKWGYSGYCGVMANFQANLYHRLYTMWKAGEKEETMQRLSDYLGFCSVLESRGYPANAKYVLSRKGLGMSDASRSSSTVITPSMQMELVQFLHHDAWVASSLVKS